MIISESQIRRIMPNAKSDRVADFVKSFNQWSDTFGIDSKLRAAHYIGQVAHETAELRYLEEIASGSAYDTGRLAARLGNTPEKDGDGQRYKGRGCLQTTGRRNYEAYANSKYCNGDLMSHPEWLAQFPGAQKASMFFWMTNNLNRLADRDDSIGVTKRINGGTNGLAQRQYYTRVAKRVFGVSASPG